MKTSKSRIAVVFAIATFLSLIFPIQAYLSFAGARGTFPWKEQLAQSVSTWYLWVAFFPFIFSVARKFRFEPGNRLKSLSFSIFVGIVLAIFHAVTQTLFVTYLLHPNFAQSISKVFNERLIATCFARFFNYSTILSVCIALHSYRRARETEIQSARAENGILHTQFESLKVRLDPQYLFSSLHKISKTIAVHLDEADSMIAQLGDYLRVRIETPLVFQKGTSEEDAVIEPDFKIQSTHVDITDSNPVQKWLLIILIFTFLSVYFSIQSMILTASTGAAMDWPTQMLNNAGWYIWGAMTPAILSLSLRYPLQRRRFLKHLLIHFCGFAVTWISANLLFAGLKWAANLGQYTYLSQLTLARTFGLDIICYSTIVAVESAIRYHRRFESAKLRTVRLSAELARARLQALKAQLHPHFLFNALNSLSQLMREDAQAAEEMINNLRNFLRLTLSSGETQEVSLQEELEFLKCYLAIENVRFQDRLKVKMEIDPETLCVIVPNLILQPIVENAIKHGIAPKMDPGEVEIRTSRLNGIVRISVRDDGPGLSARMKSKNKTGLGISNTKERLLQLYGENHRFELINAPEGGLLVTVEIPVSFQEQSRREE